KLAWAELLDGRPQAYQDYMELLLQRGTDAAGGDRNAQREAEEKDIPRVLLLQARLLYDGGYYDRALAKLRTSSEDNFSRFEHRLEYIYRKGRVLHGQEAYDDALAQYDRTIELGRDHEAFFACNAALQAGLIQEKRGNTASAIQYFQTCLRLRPDDYRTGLHQQAKAGLSRLGR
ncbi:MAG: hypothetical protein AAFZ63_29545, partial [Bacteroidota bacterium]